MSLTATQNAVTPWPGPFSSNLIFTGRGAAIYSDPGTRQNYKCTSNPFGSYYISLYPLSYIIVSKFSIHTTTWIQSAAAARSFSKSFFSLPCEKNKHILNKAWVKAHTYLYLALIRTDVDYIYTIVIDIP